MSGPRPLAHTLSAVAGKALGRRGLALGVLMGDWDTVVGPRLAAVVTPMRLTFPRGRRQDATLHVRVDGAAALEVQHAEPQILERINAFMGYRAVARLRLVQAPAGRTGSARPAAPVPRPLGAAEQAALDEGTARIDDPELRAALTALGRAVIGATSR